MHVPEQHNLDRAPDEPIRVVSLDAVGTLIFPYPSVAQVYAEAGRRHGSRLTQAEIGSRFRQVFREAEESPAADDFSTSESHETERWRSIVSACIPDLTDFEACFQELFAHFGSPGAWRVFPDVAPALARLSRAGLRLIIASNFDRRLHAVCDGLPSLTVIRDRVISSEIGFRKPADQFYAALVARAEVPSAEIVMVGDSESNDVLAARRAGLQAIWVDRTRPAGAGHVSDLEQAAQLLLETGAGAPLHPTASQ